MKISHRLNIGNFEVECFVCGKVFFTSDIVTVVTMDDGCDAGNLCDDCSSLSAEGIRKRIKSNALEMKKEAEELIAYAGFMNELADGEIIVPDGSEKAELMKIVRKSC